MMMTMMNTGSTITRKLESVQNTKMSATTVFHTTNVTTVTPSSWTGKDSLTRETGSVPQVRNVVTIWHDTISSCFIQWEGIRHSIWSLFRWPALNGYQEFVSQDPGCLLPPPKLLSLSRPVRSWKSGIQNTHKAVWPGRGETSIQWRLLFLRNHTNYSVWEKEQGWTEPEISQSKTRL